MDVDRLSHYASRTFFFVAFALFVLAAIEWVLKVVRPGFSLGYTPGRLIEYAAMFLIPVIAVLLRQIREELRKQRRA